jgi:putative aldouronate transport system substrate-binding protein
MKKILATLLVMCMILTMLTACGNTKEAAKTDETQEITTDQAEGSSVDVTEGVQEEKEYDYSDKDHVTLKIMIFGIADSEKTKEISEKVSEITREKLNCDVEINRIGFGTYMNQLNLALSSGEQLDIFMPMQSGAFYANAGQIQPIDQYLLTSGKDLKEQISAEDFKCGSFAGETYGVPVNGTKASELGFVMRKDIADELGIDYKNMTSFEQLHDALVKVKEACPDMYPVVSDFGKTFGSGATLYLGQDVMADNLGVLIDPTKATVENLYASDLFKERAEMMYAWAQEGLIMPDASTNSEAATSIISAGRGFGYFSHMKPGFENEVAAGTGMEMVTMKYTKPLSNTDNTGISWYVATNSVDPERAVAMLNLMYTDSEVANLLTYGVEGEDYKIIDEENGIVDYADGISAEKNLWMILPWSWPNEQIAYLMKGNSPTLHEEVVAFQKAAIQSAAKGFVFDNTPVVNQITACTAVIEKYDKDLLCGITDPSTTIPKFLEELKKNGIDDVINEKQAQLNDWLAKQ